MDAGGRSTHGVVAESDSETHLFQIKPSIQNQVQTHNFQFPPNQPAKCPSEHIDEKMNTASRPLSVHNRALRD
jgi:hypothetical protein